MSQQEKLRHHILKSQKECNPTGPLSYKSSQLSTDFHLQETYVWEVLTEMYLAGLISIKTYYGGREVELRDWPGTPLAFWHNPEDSNHVRIMVLSQGDEVLAAMSEKGSSIGFV